MTRSGPEWEDLRSHLQSLFGAAIAAADPAAAVRRQLCLGRGILRGGPHRLPLARGARIWFVAAGKASPAMARAAIEILGDRLAGGVVAHPRSAEPGGGWPACLRLFPAGHPLPDEGSLRAGEAAIAVMQRCAAGSETRPRGSGEARERGDVALVLVSGGGSALLEALPEGMDLTALRAVTEALQRAGATIQELNTVRRALSRIKGGGLRSQAAPARCLALLLSDVLDDRAEAIASGPTIPSPTGPSQALEVLDRYRVAEAHPRIVRVLAAVSASKAGSVARGADPASERSAVRKSARAEVPPESMLVTPQPAMGESAGSFWHVVASNRIALEAVRRRAESLGFRARVLTHRLQGEAREVGRVIGALAWGISDLRRPVRAPACLILGGETTVTLRGHGRGGRNLELALGAALSLEGCERAAVFSFATDGSDGNSGAAGAVVTGETIRRAADLALSPDRAFRASDSEPFFRTLGDLWISGPTGTNVNDLTLVLVYH